MQAWIGHERRLRDVRLASSEEAKHSLTIRDIEGTGMHCNSDHEGIVPLPSDVAET